MDIIAQFSVINTITILVVTERKTGTSLKSTFTVDRICDRFKGNNDVYIIRKP